MNQQAPSVFDLNSSDLRIAFSTLAACFRDMVRPVTVLAFASVLACILLSIRILLTGHFRQLFLVWNLFLAWLPLCFALVAVGVAHLQPQRRWLFCVVAVGWLLFFPNAPYILTDLVHLGSKAQGRYWADLVIILLFALTGLVLGFVSLFLMQRVLARRHGWIPGWLFAGVAALLGGFGIYVGRFLRWNTWDVLFAPDDLLAEGWLWLTAIPAEPRSLLLPLLFGVLLLVSYASLYSLTHLQSRSQADIPPFIPSRSIR